MELLVRPEKITTTETAHDSDHVTGYGLSTSDLRTLAELGNVFGSDKSLNDGLDWLSEHIKQLIPYDRFMVDLLSTDRRTVTTIHETGIGTAKLQPVESEPIEGTLAGYVAVIGESLLESSVTEAMRLRFRRPRMWSKTGFVPGYPYRCDRVIPRLVAQVFYRTAIGNSISVISNLPKSYRGTFPV